MLALLAAALLLMGMLPMGALAGDMPDQITHRVMAEVLRTDADCQISMMAWDALYAYVPWEEMNTYSYTWTISSGLDPYSFTKYEQDPMAADYVCTKKEADTWWRTGKVICQCEVSDGKKKLTTINFVIDEVIYVPIAATDTPWVQYVYYTPGDSVAVSIPEPSIGGNQKIDYQWLAYKSLIEGEYEGYGEVNAPSIILENLGAEKDGWTLECQVATAGYLNYRTVASFVLMSREKKPIEMPVLSSSWKGYELEPDKSETLTLPTATSGDPNKTVEYRWYMANWDSGEIRFYKTTSTPKLTVTNTPDMRGKGVDYLCRAGYKGDPEDTFLEYGMSFSVEYLTSDTPTKPTDPTKPATPTSVPKTGDNTPLTALFLLLGISLAGVTVLASKRRGHEHS